MAGQSGADPEWMSFFREAELEMLEAQCPGGPGLLAPRIRTRAWPPARVRMRGARSPGPPGSSRGTCAGRPARTRSWDSGSRRTPRARCTGRRRRPARRSRERTCGPRQRTPRRSAVRAAAGRRGWERPLSTPWRGPLGASRALFPVSRRSKNVPAVTSRTRSVSG
ncbi:hypothetical protein EAO73_16875 [Streptomyces sp. col6]|nr:hypothetical protein EAO73_16875 [Streptomyces sp. col6]